MYVFCHLPSLLQEPPRGFLTFIHSSKSLSSNPHVYQTLHRGPVILWQKMGVASAVMGLTTFPKSPLTLRLGALLAQLCPVTHLLEKLPLALFLQNTCTQTSSGSPQTTLHPSPTSNETSYSPTDPWLSQHPALAYLVRSVWHCIETWAEPGLGPKEREMNTQTPVKGVNVDTLVKQTTLKWV